MKEFVVSAAEKAAGFIRRNGRVFMIVGLTVAGTAICKADGAPDASTIVTTAETTFTAVGGLVAAAVGFFIIVKIVKWIRK